MTPRMTVQPLSQIPGSRLTADAAKDVTKLARGDKMTLLRYVSALVEQAYRDGEVDCAHRIEVMIEDGHPVTHQDGGT